MNEFPIARRLLLGSMLAMPFIHSRTNAQTQTMREILEHGIEMLQSAATRRQLTGSWEQPGVPIRSELLPPATPSRIAAVETSVGAKMPPGLRRFFNETTAGLDVMWLLPGRSGITESGLYSVNHTSVPPPPFGSPGPKPQATMNAGGLRIMLDDIEQMRGEWEWWRDARKQGAQNATDPFIKAHQHYHATIWQRGFPIARTMGGDIIAIDTADPMERLMILRHDGDDAPVLLLGHDLLTHLTHQARLRFVGFENFRMELFADAQQGEKAVSDFTPTVQDLIVEHDLFLPNACVIDADGENGKAWRAWTDT